MDSKLNVALEGKFGLIAKVLRTKIGSDKLEFPFSLYSQDYYFVPHFTKPECSPVTISRVGMASVVSRENPLLMGVNVGFDVSDGRSWTFHDKFKGEDSRRMNTSFTGFEYDTKYTVTPSLKKTFIVNTIRDLAAKMETNTWKKTMWAQGHFLLIFYFNNHRCLPRSNVSAIPRRKASSAFSV